MRKAGKRLISQFLVFVMVLGFLPTVSLAAGTNNATVNAAVAAGIDSSGLTADISNDPSVIGTLDLDDLHTAYPNLVMITANNTNITNIIDTTNTGISVWQGAPGTFIQNNNNDRALTQTITSIGYSLSGGSGIDLNALIADLGVNVTDGTTVGDLIDLTSASSLARVTIDGSTVSPVAGGVFGSIGNSSLSGLNVGSHTLTLELNFRHTQNYTYVVSYALNIRDVSLSINPTSAQVHQGGSYTFTVTKLDENGQQVTLSPGSLTVNLTTAASSTYTTAANGDAVDITVNIDPAETAGAYTLSATDSVSGKSASAAVTVAALNSVTGIVLEEYNANTSAGNFDPSTDTMYIRGGTSISSGDVGTLTGYNTSTVYLLYDDNSGGTPIALDSNYLAVFTANDPSGNVTGEFIEVAGQAALRVSAAAVTGSALTGTLTLSASSLGVSEAIDYSVMAATPTAYGIYRIDSANYPSLSSVNIQGLIDSGNSDVTLISEYTHDGSGWNPPSGGRPTVNILEGKTYYFVAVAKYGVSNDPWFVAPYGSAAWHESLPGGGSVIFGSTWSGFVECADIDGMTAYSSANATQSLAVKANLGSGGETVTALAQLNISGGSPNTLYFNIFVTPRSVDHYEFWDATGTNQLTTDNIAIGDTVNYRVYAVYDNGNVEQVNFSSSTLGLTVGNYDASIITSAQGGGTLFTATATRNGGLNDAKVGQDTTITLTDRNGKTGSLRLVLDHSLVESFTYYVETPSGIYSYPTSANPSAELTTLYAAAGLPGNVLEIPRGLTANVWVVPKFSNDDMYHSAVDNANVANNDWMAYGVNISCGSAVGSGSGLNAPSFNSTTKAYEVAVTDERIEIGTAISMTFSEGGALGNPSVSSNGQSHRLKGSNVLSTSFNVKIVDPVLTNLDVEVYDEAADDYSGAITYTAGHYEITGAVGNEVILRVKAVYSDGSAIDFISNNSAGTYTGGTYFLPMDTYSNYDPATGNLTTPDSVSLSDFGSGTDSELSVLYGRLMSRRPSAYSNLVNTGTAPTASDWISPLTSGTAVQSLLLGLTEEITPNVVSAPTGVTNGVVFDYAAKAGGIVPGHFSIRMNQAGNYTLDFSGAYSANGYNSETLLNDISGVPIEIRLTVQDPTIERVYLVSDDTPWTSQTTAAPITDLHMFDITGASTPYTFYVYPVILDSSYYTTSAYAANGMPSYLTGTSDVGAVTGLNYMSAADWNDSVPAFTWTAGSSNILVTRDDVGGLVRLKVQILGTSVPQASPETIRFDIAPSLAQTSTATRTYSGVTTGWEANLFGVYTTNTPVVQDITVGASYSNPTTPTSNTVELNGTIYYPVEYMLSDMTTRALTTGEYPAPGATGTNVLVVTEVTAPGTYTYSMDGYGMLRFFNFSAVGTYSFKLSTQIVNGDTIPTTSQGDKLITFTVTARNLTQSIYYGQSAVITPSNAASYAENGSSLLDANALANGILQMVNNANGTAVVDVKDSSGAVIAKVTVTLQACTETVEFVPAVLTTNSPWYVFADGESMAVQWKTTYTTPASVVTKVTYTGVASSEWVFVAGTDFLSLNNGSVTAISSAAAYAIYRATPSGGTAETIYAQIDPTLPLPSYTYELRDNSSGAVIPSLSLPKGQSANVSLYETSSGSAILVTNFTVSDTPAGVVALTNVGNSAAILGQAVGSTTITFSPLQGGSITLPVTVTAAGYNISGAVTNSGTSTGINGATVTATNTATGTMYGPATTTTAGNYTINNVPNGSYTVTATASGYASNGTTATVSGASLTNVNIALTPSSASAASLSLSANTISVGSTATATVTASGFGSPVTYAWGSSNPAVATVSGSGNTATVTGVAAGTTTITCTVSDGVNSVIVTPVTLTVTTATATLSLANTSITVGSSTTATVADSGFSSPTYTWNSSNPTAATVSGSGNTATVTGVAAGTFVITCTVNDATTSLPATATITVTTGGGGPSGGGGGGPSTYAVTYNANGGSGSRTVSGLASGATHTVLASDAAGITRSGYTFQGWNTQANGNGTDYDAGDSITVTASVTLYAQWKSDANLALNMEDHFAYLAGNDQGNFNPDAKMTRAQVAQMLYNLLLDNSRGNSASFSDVSSGAWYYEAVITLADKGVISGYTDGTFRPNASITRAEFVTMLSKFTSVSSGSSPFSDVTTSHWAYDYIVSATAKGWIGGYTDGTFRPNQGITRAEAVRVTNVLLGRSADTAYVDANPEINIFSDVKTSHWAYYEIMEATVDHDYTKDSSNAETWSK